MPLLPLSERSDANGSTPMLLRKNALVGAARMIEAIDKVGLDHLPGVASVGLIENRPNSRNVVPGEVFVDDRIVTGEPESGELFTHPLHRAEALVRLTILGPQPQRG